jgi:hypothetical protein
VVEADESDELLAEITGERDKLSFKDRDERGRFVPKDGAAPDEDVPPEPDAPPKPAKFKFGGSEWDTQEQAEQNFRTLRGQFKAYEGKAREFDKAAASARGWHAETQRLQAELEGLRGGKGATETAPAAEQEAQPAGESIDWAMYAEVKKAAAEAGQPELAEKWLHGEQERVLDARMQAMLDEQMAPVRDAEQNAFVDNHVAALFDSLGGYVLPGTDTPAYPELADPTTAAQVGRLWHDMGLPTEIALTPQGAVAAIQLYRGTRASLPASVTASPAPVPAPVQVPVSSDATTVLEEGMDVGDPLMTLPTQRSPEASRIAAALRKSGASLHVPGLGFSR